MSELKPGLGGSAKLLVDEAHTAPRIGSGRVHVLATPVMIDLTEAPALDAAEHLLRPGSQSLGTQLDVSLSRPRRSACASRHGRGHAGGRQ